MKLNSIAAKSLMKLKKNNINKKMPILIIRKNTMTFQLIKFNVKFNIKLRISNKKITLLQILKINNDKKKLKLKTNHNYNNWIWAKKIKIRNCMKNK